MTYLRIEELIITIFKSLNNRELAMGTWAIIGILLALTNSQVRKSMYEVVKCMFFRKFIVIYLLIAVYVSVIIYSLFRINFIESYMYKDLLIWSLFSGIFSAFKAIKEGKDFVFFKAYLDDIFKVTLIFEFVANLYTFTYTSELLILPALLLVVLINSSLEILPEFKTSNFDSIRKIAGFIQNGILFFIIINSIRLTVLNYRDLLSIATLKTILLPVILSTTFIGFIYGLALWSGYEQIYSRLEFGEKKSKSLLRFMKLKILFLCKLNIDNVTKFWSLKGISLLSVKSKSDVNEIINNYKVN